jgi:hypothetical protein
MAAELRADCATKLVSLERDPFGGNLALFLVFLGPLLFLTSIVQTFPPGILGLNLLAAGLVWRRSRQQFNLRPLRIERDVRFADDGVYLDGKLAVPRSKIAAGYFHPRPSPDPRNRRSAGPSLRLLDSRERILVDLELDEPAAHAILRRYGVDVTQRRSDFVAASPLYSTRRRIALFSGSVIALAMVLSAVVSGLPILGLVPPLLALSMIVGGMWPTRVSVGLDGVLVRWLWQERFVPMREIERIRSFSDGEVRLMLRSGKTVSFWTAMLDQVSGDGAPMREAIVARIQDALEARRTGMPALDLAALVGRRGRAPSAWLAALRQLRTGEGGYREGAVRDDDLWRAVEDPTAAEDVRAGAAAALRCSRSLDEVARQRVRVAAEATASPKLRVALDAATGDSEEALASALDDFGDDEAAKSANST